MFNRIRTLFLVLALTLLGAPAALAQLAHTPIEPGQFYVSLGAGGQYIEVPKSAAFLTNPTQHLGGTDEADWGWVASGGLGYAFGEDCFLGAGTRLELGGSITGMETSNRYLAPDFTIAVFPISGGFADGDDDSDGGVDELDYDAYQADLLLRTELGNDGLGLEVFGGFTYTRTSLEQTHSILFSRLLPPSRQIEADVDTDYYGLALGAGIDVPLFAGFVFYVDARADIMGADANLAAKQQGFFFASERDDDSGFAARVGGSAGVSRRIGPAAVSVEAVGSWLSYAPQIVYPVSPDGRQPAGPIHLDDDDLWNVGGRLLVTVPF